MQMHESKASEIMRSVHEYIKTVQNGARVGTLAGAGAGANNLNVDLDSNGYPMLPCPPSWDKLAKRDLEKVYRTYMKMHYRKPLSLSVCRRIDFGLL